MLSVAEAQARLLALAPPVAEEQASLARATGRWTAAPVPALRTQPEVALSAMDGYAIRAADLPGPWTLVGESAAGRPLARTIGAGEAARIFTGAALPDGTDTILIQEDAARQGDTLTLTGDPPTPGMFVRPAGLDFRMGEPLIATGARLTPARIALAAMAGHATLPVRRRLRIALAATGDELRTPGTALAPGQTPETNGVMLAAMLADLPVDITDLGILPDRIDALTAAFAGIDADLIVTSGGASVGDHDLIAPALSAAGGELDFWRVAMRPGKPMLAGRLGAAVAIGLPGNPVSAFVTASLFVAPMIAHLAGAADPLPQPRRAVLAHDLPPTGPRADYLRGWQQGEHIHAAPVQDSAMLRTLARATCLILRPPHAPPASAGDSVQILDIS